MEELNNKTLRIALDAMGGDFAPQNEVRGAIDYFTEFKPKNVEIVFVGNEEKIKGAIRQSGVSEFNYTIKNATEVVGMDDEPSSVIKKKKDSSLYLGIELHSNKLADAFVSTGNTGAVMATATLLLGRIKGVSRPTIGAFFPTLQNYPTLLLDVGATIDCKARQLYEFAVMGSIYASQILDIDNPKTALLNIGEEKSKGNEILQQARSMIDDSQLNFIGNVEGGDILLGTADVIICDGFTGNVILKFAESFLPFLKTKIKKFADKNIVNTLMVGLTVPTLKRVFKEFDYQEYGGVPLLGVNGVVIIGHGKSSPKAVMNMIKQAVNSIKRGVNEKIEHNLNIDKSQTTMEQN